MFHSKWPTIIVLFVFHSTGHNKKRSCRPEQKLRVCNQPTQVSERRGVVTWIVVMENEQRASETRSSPNSKLQSVERIKCDPQYIVHFHLTTIRGTLLLSLKKHFVGDDLKTSDKLGLRDI